ncbi:hypothetical protein HYN59_09900 [Flavobacterium album]|uniref:Uncharacterized protein n=1 Tax=Flavobacterium album TaxID=2175091 RepID=A0A2S1QYD9_9FLAO|nr:hypothetical protein [Flavobacterium album]AWH85408.1 hypothetical protein HYN59_09900 [Flavobacterium album]
MSQRESLDKDGNLRDKLTNESYHETDYLVSKIKNVFPKEDFRIIQRQLNDTIAFQLHSEKLLAEVNLISDDTISKMSHNAEQANNSSLFWEQYHGKYGEKALITISKPIFSKNGTIAVVSLGYSYGRLSGYGQTFVLEKVNKKWKIKKVLSMWIS